MQRRVVITGYGAITPIGNNVKDFWGNIKAGKCGIDFIKAFDAPEDYKIKVSAESDFNVEDFIEKREARKMNRFCQMGIASANEAIAMSGIDESDIDRNRIGVLMGSGIGGISTVVDEHNKLLEAGPRRVSPFMVTMIISNILSGTIAINHKYYGHCSCVVTACSTGNNAIGDAFDLIRFGKLDAVIAGGAESAIDMLPMTAFANMTALTTSDDPLRASIPFDKDRNGFVMGEGAGTLILEEYECAKRRGAKILAEVVGYGSTCDAYHVTAPDPEGKGATAAMEMAVKDAGIDFSEIGYINAHGTSTPFNDRIETLAIKKAFKDAAKDVAISSTKSMTGHLLGAAGAAEAIVCINALMEGFIPATIGYKNFDPECDLDIVPNVGREKKIEYALTNSFGFGGHNATLLFKRSM